MCMDAGSAGGRGGIAQPAASSNTQAADPTCNQAMKRSIMVDLENAALFHAIPRYPVRCAVHRAKSSALLLLALNPKRFTQMRANLGMGFDSISALQRDGRFLNISHPVLDPAQTIQNVGIIRRALDGFLNQLLRL